VKYPAFGAPTVFKDKVLIGVGEGDFVHSAQDPIGVIHCLSLKDGSKLWETKLADTVLGAITVMDGQAYACSPRRERLRARRREGDDPDEVPDGLAHRQLARGHDRRDLRGQRRRAPLLHRPEVGKIRFTTPVSPGSPIVSSPAVAAGKLFIGTRNKGMLCLADPPADAEKKVVLQPADAVAGRTGCADDRGLPAVNGDTSDLKWPMSDGWKAAVKGGSRCRAIRSSCRSKAARPSWIPSRATPRRPGRPPPPRTRPPPGSTGSASGSSTGNCAARATTTRSCSGGWPRRPRSPTFLRSRATGFFITTAGKDKAKAFIEGRKLVDGSLAWRRELDDAPLSPVVAAGDWCAVATADEKIAVFGSSGGKLREPLPVGGKPVAPALCGDVVIVAGENRIAAHDLSSSEWIWNYKDQDNIGMVSGQPIILGETIWVGTAKRGLVAIGIPKPRPRNEHPDPSPEAPADPLLRPRAWPTRSRRRSCSAARPTAS
jgi:outer membrane protein assembly factor BamB